MNPQFWRRWHRWIGFPATIFLLFAAITGVLVAGTEFFGEEESLREANRRLTSPVTLRAPQEQWAAPVARALAAAAARAGDAPVDRITIEFKGEKPRVMVFTGRPGGGEDRKFVLDARTGALLAEEAYADKPFLYRLHSGEAFGDGGLVLAMGWGLTLIILTVTGLIIYLTMRRRNATGLQRVFW